MCTTLVYQSGGRSSRYFSNLLGLLRFLEVWRATTDSDDHYVYAVALPQG